MGRAYRRNKTRSNGASAFLPMVYLGTNFAQDFFNATPDNDKEGQSIILVGDATHTDFKTGFYGWLEYPISIIFSANLKTIDSALLATEDFTEHLMEDVRDSIRNLLGKSYRVSIDSETREFETVYSEFDIGVGTTNKPLLPMTYFRFECTLTVKEDCGNNVLDRCTAILQNLTATDLNECILPTYDFSDTTVQANVTAQQQTDLQAWLCTAVEYATRFNKIDESIDFGNDASVNFDNSDPFSGFIWIQTPTDGGTVMKKYTSASSLGWSFATTSTQKLDFIMRSNFSNYFFIRGTATLPASGFSCIGFTYDGSGVAAGMKFYINGVSSPFTVSRDTLTTSILTSFPFAIGKADGQISGYFGGLLKTASIWDRVITPTEALSIYTAGRDRPDYTALTNLVSFWDMVALNPIDDIGVNNGTSINMNSSNIVKI